MNIGVMDPLWFFFLALGIVVLIVEAFAFIDAARRPADAYVAADKQTKNLWLVLLGLAVVLNIAFRQGVLSIFVIVGLIVALIYLLDVRPAVRSVQENGGSNQGPYGPW